MPSPTRWRVLPWDPAAAAGAAYTPHYRPPPGSQTGGRFDIGTAPVLYLASEPEHGIAEVLQRFRGKRLRDEHLLRPDRSDPTLFHRLAVVEARIGEAVETRLLDLDSAAALDSLGLRPSQLASHERSTTQKVARRIHDDPARYSGFEWWSALTGAWRSTVLFLDRVPDAGISYGAPDHLHLDHPAVAAARVFLDIG